MSPKYSSTRALDGGYGWVIVFCAFMLQGTSCGISFSVGVFFVEWLEAFEQTHDVTAWVGSLNTGIMFAGGPLAGLLINKCGHRAVAFSGGILCSVGLVLASYANSIYMLFITYGVIGGFGVCFMFIPGAVVCSTYFDRYRPIAMGIATAGVGMFCLVMPPVLRLAVDHYGWRGAMICMSAFSVQSCLYGYMLIPMRFWQRGKKWRSHIDSKSCELLKSNVNNNGNSEKTGEVDEEERNDRILRKISQYVITLCDAELLCSIRFYIYFLSNALWNCGSLIILVMVPDYAINVGISKDKAAILLSTIGFGGLLGRFGAGLLANLQNVNCFWVYTVSTLISGLAIGGIPVFENFSAFCVMCVTYGVCFGAQCGVLAVTTIKLVGLEKLATAFGYVMVSHGLGALSGPPLAGLLYEATSAYHIPFYFGCGISLFAGLLACLIPLIDRVNKQKFHETVILESEVNSGQVLGSKPGLMSDNYHNNL